MIALRIGIIGCGNISSAYLRLAPLFAPLRLVAVADRDPAVADLRAREFGLEARSTDDLLASDDIDLIVNLTIPEAHFDVTRAILMAGKHAYSEKPLTLDLAQGAELVALAQDRGLRLGVAPDTFLGGTPQQARALIDEGAVGEILSGSAHFMNPGMEQWHPNPDFFFRPGGGPVLDMGPYYITLLVHLLGPVRRVAAMGRAARSERTIGTGARAGEQIAVTTPTTLNALLDFASGACVPFTASWDVQAHGHGHVELYGTTGSLFLPDPNFFGGPLQMAGIGNELREISPWAHPLGAENDTGQTPPMANYRTAGLADMADAIATGRPHRCSGELALHVTEVMMAILRSAETGDFISLSTTCDRPAPLTPDQARGLMA